MEIHTEDVGQVTVIRISGDLNATTAGEAHDKVVPLLQSGKAMLLDFSEVEHVTDAGLRTMLVIYRQAQASACRVAVVGLSTELHSALKATGFLRYFMVAQDVNVGVEALQQAERERSLIG